MKQPSTALVARHKTHTLCRRRSDGTFYEPSHPDGYNAAEAMTDMLAGDEWYLCEIKPLPKRWWQRHRRWQRTGNIWITDDPMAFDVLDRQECEQALAQREKSLS